MYQKEQCIIITFVLFFGQQIIARVSLYMWWWWDSLARNRFIWEKGVSSRELTHIKECIRPTNLDQVLEDLSLHQYIKNSMILIKLFFVLSRQINIIWCINTLSIFISNINWLDYLNGHSFSMVKTVLNCG